jgi:hypothetical protein
MAFNPLRVPERLFSIAMWVVSLVFASFLIGLGGKVVGDLPGVDQRLEVDAFLDSAADARRRADIDSLEAILRAQEAERERIALLAAASAGTYRAARESFENWVATRRATTDPAQDPEVIARTRQLDSLRDAARRREAEREAVDALLLETRQARADRDLEALRLREAASGRFERVRFGHELRIFGVRLAITLPLLLAAAWAVARRRRSEYWPLYRGFVLFGVFVFFVELVPYLPSYGGYVRYGVGIIASLVAGHYVIRAMRRYVDRRQQAAAQSEAERRRALGYEEALKRIGAGVCPGCERAIATGPTGPGNYCVHCGMRLFDECGSCRVRKNAFFQFCPSCGVTAGRDEEPTPALA